MFTVTDQESYTFETGGLDAYASVTHDANGRIIPSVAWTTDGEFIGNCPNVGPYHVETFPAKFLEYGE